MKDDLQSQAANPDMWKVLKAKFEKSSVPSELCRQHVFRKRDHDDYPDDDVPPKGEKESRTMSYVQQQQEDYDVRSDIPEIDEDEDIFEDASLQFLEEIKSLGDNKVSTIADHQRMEATLKDMMKKQFRTAEEIVNEKEFDQDFMEEILVKRADNKAYIFSEADYQYLNKNDIKDIYQIKINLTTPTLIIPGIKNLELHSFITDPFIGIVYENIKKQRRVMGLKEIPNFCDATLEKVVKEVSAIVCVARYKLKDPPLSYIDKDIMELSETKIKKRLKHQRQMKR
ncbi:hypothetical protein Tco_0514115 [Tanacetum coccineum]